MKKEFTKSEQEALDKVIKQAKWIEAKTYRSFAPHEYIRSWQEADTFNLIQKYIDKYAINKRFRNTSQYYDYFYYKGKKYWSIATSDTDPPCIILNRAGEHDV